MASFTRTHGNAQQVFHIDTDNGSLSGALAASAPVNFTGPKLDFFKLIVENGSNAAQDLQAEVGTGLAVEAIIEKIQNGGAGVYLYQVEDDTTGQISLGIYPTGAYTTSTLQTAVRTLTAAGSNSINCTGSDVTSGNFKLA
tara:strand:- start:7347 stop:7769 length:423 start_codon:yes stop_codon:yes gene_type:complete